MGRQCQIQMMVPASDLTPPLPDKAPSTTTTKSLIGEEQTKDPEKSTTSKLNLAVNSHQGHVDDTPNQTPELETILTMETTVKPLETIFITDPSTIDPAATAGKWPTEPPTESPITDNDADNEA